LIEEVKDYIKELGIEIFAIIKPLDFSFRKDYLIRWISSRFHGEMDYMARNLEKRLSPEKLYPEVKSILIVGIPYDTLRWNDIDKKGRGLISKYAIRRDYHRVIKKKLKKILSFLREKNSEIQGRIYVDSAPVLEKELARLAGIGFIGKNTMLISKKFGSYFFLGELFLNIELEEIKHPPVPLLCASCKRCVEACPSGAIVKPYILDASRCISYLTIEYRGIIKDDLENKMGQWIFGCDECQEVCPFNRKNKPLEVSLIPDEKRLANIKLEELILLRKEDFEEIFKGTPVKRAGYEMFMRNVFIAAGNSGKKELLQSLRKREKDFLQNPIVYHHLLRAIKKLENNRSE